MLDFIYDSLDTVKKLKFPTWKQIWQLTGAVFSLTVIGGIYFILLDTVFSDGYKTFYSAMKGEEVTWPTPVATEQVIPQQAETLDLPVTAELPVNK